MFSHVFSVFVALFFCLFDLLHQLLISSVELFLAFGELFGASVQFSPSLRLIITEIRVGFAKVGVVRFKTSDLSTEICVVILKSRDLSTEVGIVRLKSRDLLSRDLHSILQVCLHGVFGLSLFFQVLSHVRDCQGLLHQVMLHLSVSSVRFVQALLTLFQELLTLCESDRLVNMCHRSKTFVFLWLPAHCSHCKLSLLCTF